LIPHPVIYRALPLLMSRPVALVLVPPSFLNKITHLLMSRPVALVLVPPSFLNKITHLQCVCVSCPLLSARVPFRPRVCPFRVHVVRRLCVGFASGVVRLLCILPFSSLFLFFSSLFITKATCTADSLIYHGPILIGYRSRPVSY
jgi:hypothetical protein